MTHVWDLLCSDSDQYRDGYDPVDYCGCCGVEIAAGYAWCVACESHVKSEGQMHERTWFAQFGYECPQQC